jgi:membrane-associated protease RseP (regulator of RpoE activity)
VTTILSFIVVIGILILIHELGHFVVARWMGVGVERFSVGFGPVLLRWKGKETEYCLSLVPVGGYVKMMGEESPLEGKGSGVVDPGKSFSVKPPARPLRDRGSRMTTSSWAARFCRQFSAASRWAGRRPRPVSARAIASRPWRVSAWRTGKTW